MICSFHNYIIATQNVLLRHNFCEILSAKKSAPRCDDAQPQRGVLLHEICVFEAAIYFMYPFSLKGCTFITPITGG